MLLSWRILADFSISKVHGIIVTTQIPENRMWTPAHCSSWWGQRCWRMMGFVLDWGGQDSVEQWFECITSAPGELGVGLETENPFLFKTTVPLLKKRKKKTRTEWFSWHSGPVTVFELALFCQCGWSQPYQKSVLGINTLRETQCNQRSLILEQMCLPFLLVKESI